MHRERHDGENAKHPEFAERLAQAMDAKGLPKKGRTTWVAKALQQTRPMGFMAMSGRALPAYENTALLAHALGVSHQWLRHGQGDMHGGAAPVPMVPPMVIASVPADRIPAGAQVISGQSVMVLVPANAIPQGATVMALQTVVPYDEYVAMATHASFAGAGKLPNPPRRRRR